MSDQPDMTDQPGWLLKDYNDYQDYKRIFGRLRKEYQEAFQIAVINFNTNAFNDESKTASVEFISFDALEDVMPFLAWDGTTYDLVATYLSTPFGEPTGEAYEGNTKAKCTLSKKSLLRTR